ncbi:MAG: SdiA-regulated domain-containing protein [Bacteroidota bacterium]|nr:SdiA-regulated domain-containing protein [Bacteroidota bacterium]
MKLRIIHIILIITWFSSTLTAQLEKTGPSYKVIKGSEVELNVESFRGTLQWQMSSDKITWYSLDNQLNSSLIYTVDYPVYIRLGVKENNCDWLYSGWVNYIPISQPIVLTNEVVNIGQDSVQYSGEVISNGNGTVSRRGVCYGPTNPPSIEDSFLENGSDEGFFWGIIRALNPYTTYFLRTFAENEAGIAYGNTVSFKTLAGLPVIITGIADPVTQTTAVLQGAITSNGGAEIEARGFCWGLQPYPNLSGEYSDEGAGSDDFSSAISELTPATTYHYRAFAMNEAGIAFGLDKEFTTPAEKPSVSTGSFSQRTDVIIRIYGSVSYNGGAELTETGICWSDQPNPDISSDYLATGSPASEFNLLIQGLEPSSTYYFRAYAKNEYATGYGDQLELTTKASGYYTTESTLTENTRNNFKGWSGIYPDYGSSGNGFSGITYNWDEDQIYIVGNNARAIWVAHAPGSAGWSDSSPGSSYIKTIPLNGYADPEGICYLGNGWVMIADESLREVSFTKISAQTTSITKSSASVTIDPTKLFNTSVSLNPYRRLEGIAYDFHNKILYGLCEIGTSDHPRLFAWDWDFENQKIDPNSQREVTDFFSGLKDTWDEGSDLHYSALLKRLYVVSGEDDVMAEYNCPHPDEAGYGQLISTRQLPRSNGSSGNYLGDCEGICISRDGTQIFLCFENESFGYGPLPFVRFLENDNLPTSLYPFQ